MIAALVILLGSVNIFLLLRLMGQTKFNMEMMTPTPRYRDDDNLGPQLETLQRDVSEITKFVRSELWADEIIRLRDLSSTDKIKIGLDQLEERNEA